MPTPLLDDNKLYLVTDSGQASCLNATTGEPFYQQARLDEPYNVRASPVGANGKMYLAVMPANLLRIVRIHPRRCY